MDWKLVVVGEGAVGKSTLTMQFVHRRLIPQYDPTIEDSYRKTVSWDLGKGQESLLLDILDTAGNEEYAALRDQYMRLGQGFLLIYSITSRSSFESVQKYIDQISRVKDVDPDQLGIIIVANKIDLEDQRQVSTQEGKDLAAKLGFPFIETSAQTHVNVDEAFRGLCKEIVLKGLAPNLVKSVSKPKNNSKPKQKLSMLEKLRKASMKVNEQRRREDDTLEEKNTNNNNNNNIKNE